MTTISQIDNIISDYFFHHSSFNKILQFGYPLKISTPNSNCNFFEKSLSINKLPIPVCALSFLLDKIPPAYSY